jgi:hypothetical protein
MGFPKEGGAKLKKLPYDGELRLWIEVIKTCYSSSAFQSF